LISFGISEENMRVSAITGLIVDIEGTGPESIDEGGPKQMPLICVAMMVIWQLFLLQHK